MSVPRPVSALQPPGWHTYWIAYCRSSSCIFWWILLVEPLQRAEHLETILWSWRCWMLPVPSSRLSGISSKVVLFTLGPYLLEQFICLSLELLACLAIILYFLSLERQLGYLAVMCLFLKLSGIRNSCFLRSTAKSLFSCGWSQRELRYEYLGANLRAFHMLSLQVWRHLEGHKPAKVSF